MNDTTEFSAENLINVSTQNNFCGYYVLARRIINDNNFAVITEKFNQFYQTNWYSEQLARVVESLHPQQADIMLGLVIYDELKEETVDTHKFPDLCNDFGYDLSLFEHTKVELPSAGNLDEFAALQAEHGKKIFVLLHRHDSRAIGHYYLVEPDESKVTDYKEKCSTDVEHTYAINNEGGDTEAFIKNIQESVANIKPNWTSELKDRQIQQDELFALQLIADDRRRFNDPCLNQQASIKHFSFFKENPISITEQEETEVIELQRKEIEHYNNLLIPK